MAQAEALIDELTVEAETTRRVLERLPDDRLTWWPHPRSLSLGQLGLHVAVLPGAVTELVSRSPRESVYLRLLHVPVPALNGSSADEDGF